MPNEYIFLDNGTWESYGPGPEYKYDSKTTPPQPGSIVICETQKVTDAASTGSASGRLTFKAFKVYLGVYCPNAYFQLITAGSGTARPSLTVFAGKGGKEYIVKCKVMTPSTNPIGSNDLNIRISPGVNNWALPVNGSQTIFPILITKKTVLQITDSWQELEYRFLVNGNNISNISVVLDDQTLRPEDLPTGVAWDRSGTLNVNGVLYIDDVTLTEVVACDLAYGSPQYTKTNETAALNDGSITVNASSSFARQYRIDGGSGFSAWQVSATFPGLSPGSYTVEVRDVNGCTLAAIPNIPITAYVPPACDLVIQNVIVTNETGVGANDGTATIVATSSKVREYSLDGVTWQAGGLFDPLPPGNYIARVRNTDLTCPTQQPFVVLQYNAPPSAAPLLVDQKPINSYNFISWFNTDGKINFSSLQFSNCFWDLPKAYRNNKVHGKHYPVVVNNEQFTFYINFDEDYAYPGFSSLRLDLVNMHGLVVQNIGALKQVFQDDNVNYFIYASVSLVGIDPGIYRLAITDTSTTAPYNVLFISNEIQVMSATEAPKVTARFRYRCSMSIFRYLYSKLSEEFLLEIRLKVNVLEEQPDGEITTYRAVSTGKLRKVSIDFDKWLAFETYFFDDLAHRAMFVWQAHDYLLINDKSYEIKELYKVQWEPHTNTNKGSIQLYEQAFSMSNKYGQPNDIGVSDPVLGSDDGNVIGT